MDEHKLHFLGAMLFTYTFKNSGLQITSNKIIYCEGILQNNVIK